MQTEFISFHFISILWLYLWYQNVILSTQADRLIHKRDNCLHSFLYFEKYENVPRNRYRFEQFVWIMHMYNHNSFDQRDFIAIPWMFTFKFRTFNFSDNFFLFKTESDKMKSCSILCSHISASNVMFIYGIITIMPVERLSQIHCVLYEHYSVYLHELLRFFSKLANKIRKTVQMQRRTKHVNVK